MLTTRDRYRLAGEAGCSPQTVERWALGAVVVEAKRKALEATAAKLGIEHNSAPAGQAESNTPRLDASASAVDAAIEAKFAEVLEEVTQAFGGSSR